MASGNIWQMLQDLDTEKIVKKTRNKFVKRSSSFHEGFRPRSTSNREEGSSRPLRRVVSTHALRDKVLRSRLRRFQRQPISVEAGEEDAKGNGAEKTKKGWSNKSMNLGKKFSSFLKKAGQTAGEILEGESRDSEEDDVSKKSKTGSDETESFYDAPSSLAPSAPAVQQIQPPIDVKAELQQTLPPIYTTDVNDVTKEYRRTSSSTGRDTLDDIMPLAPEELPNMKKVYVFDPECPIHGHRARFDQILHRRSQILQEGMGSKETLNYSVSDMEEFPILASQAYAAKLARKRKRTMLSGLEKYRVEKEMMKIKSNLCIISVAFLFLFTAFQGLQNLQTSVNAKYGLGPISLAALYLSLACSALFIPPYFLNRLGCKLTLILSVSMYALYLLANFTAKWYSLLPASLLLGVAASCLWAAKCTYLTETGIRYAILNVESHNVVIVRFFGIFFMIVHLGQVFGNLISALILTAAEGQIPPPRDEVDETCGHYFTGTNLSAEATRHLKRPVQSAISAVCGAFFGCAVVSTLILALFLNTLKKDVQLAKQKPRFKMEVWQKTVANLRKPKHLLLIPLTIFNGMEQAFIAGEFTKAYVGCCMGISKIGFVMTSFGVADALCSLAFGPLIRLFGRMPLFMFGGVVDMLMIFTLLIWPPNSADTAIFYVIATAWGMADGVWNTQINGLWLVLFRGNLETAFANYRVWESVGFAIPFLYTPFIATETKLFILLTVLLVGMLGYLLIEIWEPLENYLLKVRFAAEELCNYYLQGGGQKKKSIRGVPPGKMLKVISEESLDEQELY